MTRSTLPAKVLGQEAGVTGQAGWPRDLTQEGPHVCEQVGEEKQCQRTLHRIDGVTLSLPNPSSVHTPQRKPPTRFMGRGIGQAGWLSGQAGPVHRARSHRPALGSRFKAAQEELVSLDEIRDWDPQPWSTRFTSISSTSLPPAGPLGPAPCDRLPLTRLHSLGPGAAHHCRRADPS